MTRVLKAPDIMVGDARIARLYDSSLLGDTAQTLFPAFDRDEVRPHEHWLCPTHLDAESGHVSLPVQTFVVEVHGSILLVDTGIGNGKDRPASEMHMLTTRYIDRLAELGIQPEDVTYVLFTHLHPDHVGWNTRLVNGAWVPTFPNAAYVMSRRELEDQERLAAAGAYPGARETFDESIRPVVEAGLADLVDDDHQLLNAFRFQAAPGHTPGQVRIELRSCSETAVFAGDVIHSPMQIPIWRWSSRFCADHVLAARSRRELLEFCVAENALMIPAHFKAPHVTRVRRAGDTFLPVFE